MADLTREPEDPELHERAISAVLADVRTCAPGTVAKFYDDETVDVRLGVFRTIDFDSGDAEEEIVTLPKVPIAWLSGAGGYLRFRLNPGDPVLVVFGDSYEGNFRAGATGAAGIVERFGLSSGHAIPTDCRHRPAQRVPAGVPNGLQIEGVPEVLLGSANLAPVAKAPAVDANFAAIASAMTTAGSSGASVSFSTFAAQFVAALTPLLLPTGASKVRAE